MFELSVACKYLIPRRRQLSVSIISIISILVISLVVWLIIVFFSVTNGLEKNWIYKLTTLTAPVRITPTDAYYHSYYYQIDSLSENSGYSHKTIREKNESQFTDPYDKDYDEEIPSHWQTPDRQSDGSLKDLVKLAFNSIQDLKKIPGLYAQDFELTASHIKLRLQRDMSVLHAHNFYGGATQSYLAYPTYLGNFEANNSKIGQTFLPIESKDLNNYLQLIPFAENHEDNPDEKTPFPQTILQKRLRNFFDHVVINQLQAKSFGWTIPKSLFPLKAHWQGCAVTKENHILRIVVPAQSEKCMQIQKSLEDQGLETILGQLHLNEGKAIFYGKNQTVFNDLTKIPITYASGNSFEAHLISSSIERAKRLDDLTFEITVPIQGDILKGNAPYRGLEIASAELKPTNKNFGNPFWIYQSSANSNFILPSDSDIGGGVILPKSFREAGVLIGDRGHLSYFAATASLLQEQRLPIYVAGFYDPGIIPIGNKFVLANPEITSIIRASHNQDDKSSLTNGINVRFDHLSQADEVKGALLKAFQKNGINRYWDIQTYKEYEFTKEIIQELQSQKNIFMLIAVVIILVACSNIISMLVILVNDKKVEIGILRSMGASSKSIALIFGFAGGVIGILGSLIGIGAAILTLSYLSTLIAFLSRLQGHDMLNASFYGQMLTYEISYEALFFVLGATCMISLLAGIVPAAKACLLKPSQILRSGS
ncbi:ABC transporter permease [Candidatus Protochlamydia sp. W-9]|uniref:ABC transporter permease n=1 Tax=Candidatus Protochlamydia sp. W-9 TaxID=1785087 RepID=UPI00096AA6E9|nr:FtsX-like permease family protein [Candidatus Protochlamydia sp. W-9]